MKFTDQLGNEIIKPDHIIPKLRRSCYGAIVHNDDSILVVKERWKPDVWSLPGGGIEQDESVMDGLRREVFEETGVIIKKTSKVLHEQQQNFYARDIDTFFDSRISIHLINDFVEQEGIKDVKEIEEKRWVHLNELNEENTHKNHYPAIKLLQRKFNDEHRHYVLTC